MACDRQVLLDHCQVNNALRVLVLRPHAKQRLISLQQNLEYVHMPLDYREVDGTETILVCVAHLWLFVNWRQGVQ